jgi:phosphoribosylpyrophosphate synthetase
VTTFSVSRETFRDGNTLRHFLGIGAALVLVSMIERLVAAALDRIVTSDSTPPPAEERLRVVRIAAHLAHAIRQLLPVSSETTWTAR